MEGYVLAFNSNLRPPNLFDAGTAPGEGQPDIPCSMSPSNEQEGDQRN